MHFSTTLIALVAALGPILEVNAAPTSYTTTSAKSTSTFKSTSTSSVKTTSSSVKTTSTSSVKTTSTSSIKTTSTSSVKTTSTSSVKATSTTTSQASASATASPLQPYSSRLQRKEWRALTKSEQLAYINAVKCLQSKPAANNLRGAKTLFDNFAATHLDLVDTPQGDTIHVVAQFLPWHRYFLYIHEQNLRSKCGYTGAQPYWNWSLDTVSLSKSPVFDPVYGFGGNGTVQKTVVPPYDRGVTFLPPTNSITVPKGNCVQNGPFANYTLHVGPGNATVDHCLARNIQDNALAESYKQETVNACTNMTNFMDMWLCLELGVGLPGNDDFHLDGTHAAVHIAVGEEMENMASSPGDPLFMLHHGNLDRIWDQWQKKDTSRVYQFMGASNQERTANATLDTPLYMQGLAADGRVRWVMNSTVLNYEYV